MPRSAAMAASSSASRPARRRSWRARAQRDATARPMPEVAPTIRVEPGDSGIGPPCQVQALAEGGGESAGRVDPPFEFTKLRQCRVHSLDGLGAEARVLGEVDSAAVLED